METGKTKKRVFIGLALGGLSLGFTFIFAVWNYYRNPTGPVVKVVLWILGFFVVAFLAAALLGITLLAMSLFRSKSLGGLSRQVFRAVNAVYPLAIVLSKLVRIDENLVRRSFVEVCNQANRFRIMDEPPGRILILAPHCLQKSDCPHKITIDIDNCRRCGECPIDRLKRIANTYGAGLAVVTGGTLARDMVKSYHPEAIIAIACERDLSSGLQDVSPLPVIGVINKRPNGSCFNTEVDYNEILRALDIFCGRKNKISGVGAVISKSGD